MMIKKYLSTLSNMQAFLRLVGLGEVEANQRMDAAGMLTGLGIDLDVIKHPNNILPALNGWYDTPQYSEQDLPEIMRRLSQIYAAGKFTRQTFRAKKKPVA